jgi:hypothetical protein
VPARTLGLDQPRMAASAGTHSHTLKKS